MKLRKNDIYLIIVVVILGIAAGLYIYLNKKPGGKAVLKYGNNQSMDIDHICERFGYIKNVGESAICLPAQASVTIISE